MCFDNDGRKCSKCEHQNCMTVDRIRDVMCEREQPLSKLYDSLQNKIIVNTGPMSSGKTTDLISKFGELTDSSGLSCLIIKPSIDNRSSKNYVETYTQRRQHCISCNSLEFCDEVIDYLDKHCHVIFIEEAQFFTDGSLVNFVVTMARKYKKCVYVYALNGDSDTNLFGDVYKLMPKWDEHHSFTSMCKLCKTGKNAAFSKSLVKKESQIAVGKQGETYISVCADCYYQDYLFESGGDDVGNDNCDKSEQSGDSYNPCEHGTPEYLVKE